MHEQSPAVEGDPASRICIIAEAPARNEMALSRPLVGESGRVFDWCLGKAGLRRGECYILNVWPFEVIKRQNGQKFYDKHTNTLLWDAGGFTPDGEEAAQEFLQRFEAWKGGIAVPMGNVALWALTGKKAITKWRGSPILVPEPERLNPAMQRCIPTVHPASTLDFRGQYHMRWMIVADMAKAKRFAGGYVPKERSLIIDPDFYEVGDFLDACEQTTRIATDVEIYTNRRCISCLSLATDPLNSICIPFIDPEGDHRWTEKEEAEIWRRIAKLIGNPCIEKINQNIGFDLWIYWTLMGFFPRGKISDPMAASAVMYPDFKKGLDTLCSLYTDQPYYKMDGGKAWFEGKGEAKDIGRFWTYSALDSAVSMETWVGNDWTPGLEASLQRNGFMDTYNMAMSRLSLALFKMDRGMRVDTDAWKAMDGSVEQELLDLQARLDDLVGHPLNIKSPKQCVEYFYTECGRDPYVSRSTGNPTTDDKALARIVRAGGPGSEAADVVLRLRSLRTLKDRYLDMTWDTEDDRLRASWNVAMTITGRFSSGQTVWGTGGNFQNWDPRVRGFLVADDDEDALPLDVTEAAA